MSKLIAAVSHIALAALAVFSLPALPCSAQQFAGIDIDADNVLRVRSIDPQLRMMQLKAAQKANPAAMTVSPMRKVSLNRLEAAVAASLAENKPLDTMELNVAGLTRVEYVIYLPGSQDIVLAGPAESIITDGDGRNVGIRSGNPTVKLEDLIVALRAFRPGQNDSPVIGCSIDPTTEGLAAMQTYFNQFGGQMPSNISAETIAGNMKRSLGLQTVTVLGVPATTRFAQTLVEADYRMKLIGIGLERPAVRMRTWVDRVPASARSANSLQRWYFVASYDSVKVSPDAMVLQLDGQGCKLIGADERVDRQGNRIQTGAAGDAASRGFTGEFTSKFDQIAETIPVFYHMRNLIDLSVVAAHIRAQDMYSAAGWDLGVFNDEAKLSVESANAPEQVETAVNAVWKSGRLMTPIGGGIQISTSAILDKDDLITTESLQQQQSAATAPANLTAGQWWWD